MEYCVHNSSRPAISNVYDVLYTQPQLQKKLPKAQETLAQAIVASGRMRLDADDECNFTRLLLPAELINVTFTHREMADPKLFARCRERLIRLLSEKQSPEAAAALADQYFERVRYDLKKRRPVSAEMEIMMARALVLCNALPVIRLIYLEGAEIFISYGHSVGDVMDVAEWQKHGNNAGMQAIGGKQNAIYVSCGGNPFLDDEERNHTGDGFPALARFMVVAAQETGHNADMVRDENGALTGRYSAIKWDREPSPEAASRRLRDVANCEYFYRHAQNAGINRLIAWERHLKFYRDNKVGGLRRFVSWIKCRAGWQLCKFLLIQRGMKALLSLPRTPYPATQLRKFFNDMLFNLSPVADVYRRDNADEEEAITCIEAIARVPQQVVKWGGMAVYCTTPSLYSMYYNTIVPACESAVQRIADRQKQAAANTPQQSITES